MNTTHLSELITEARKAQGLRQQELADLSGVSTTVIYKIESGRTDVTLNSFLSVASALGIRITCHSPLGAEISFES